MTLHEKITALLAKAESTTNEHERDAFNAKAEDLMLRYGIEQAELESVGEVKPEEIVQVQEVYNGGYAIIMPQFWSCLTRALGNLSVIQGKFRNGRIVYLIGHESDVERAQTLIRSLHLQAQSAQRRWWKQADLGHLSPWESYVARREFLSAFASGAASRIRQERKVREGEATTGAALVLASKQTKVDSWIDDSFGKLKSGRGVGGNGYGHAAGYSEGQKADVGTSSVGGQRKQVSR